MAIQYWQDASILFGKRQFAGHVKAFRLSTEVAALDTTAINTTGTMSFIAGNKSGSVDLEFMQDFDLGKTDPESWTRFSTNTPTSLVTASADGSPAYLLTTIPLSYTPLTGAVGELAMGRVSGSSATGPVVRGQLIHPSSAARTTSGTGTGRELGAVTATQSIYAALHVISASGTSPTLDVIVQSDDNADFTTPTTRITFTQATAGSAQLSSLAGAVTDTHWRIAYTIGGTDTPTFAFAVTAGIL